jgi:hypothetical protein
MKARPRARRCHWPPKAREILKRGADPAPPGVEVESAQVDAVDRDADG